MVVEGALDLSRPQNIHLVAIGGKAMSAMAEILLAMGHRVSGSDQHRSPTLDHLRSLGVMVSIGHDPTNVASADLVACSTAVPADNVERVAAIERSIPVLARPQLQGAIVRTRRPVAVSGTHGKTSCTAMLATIALRAGLDPSYIVGGDLGGGLSSARWGSGEWFVVEGDESDGTFLEVGAEIALVTNIAADHLDQWGTFDAIEAGFDRFLSEATGPTVVGADDPAAARLGRRHGSISVGTTSDADWVINQWESSRAMVQFDLEHRGELVCHVTVPEPGLHNARNAACAIVTATCMGIPLDTAVSAIATYPGVARRFDVRGEVAGITVVDDYAHNPAKVAAVLDAAAGGGWERVVAVFQPHRFSRTADLHQEFADSFVNADVVLVTEIDPSGETPRPGVTGHLIVDAVLAAHPDADIRWTPDRDRLVADVVDILRPGDVCLTVGAGDITNLGDELLDALGSR